MLNKQKSQMYLPSFGSGSRFVKGNASFKRFNYEQMMSTYAYIMTDRYRQQAEAAQLRINVFTAKLYGESDTSIITKVKNAAKDLWRIIKKIISKFVIFLQEAVIKLNIKNVKIKQIQDFLINSLEKMTLVSSSMNYGSAETFDSFDVVDTEKFAEAYHLEDIYTVEKVKNKKSSVRAQEELDGFVRQVTTDPENAGGTVKSMLEMSKKSLEDAKAIYEKIASKDFKKPEPDTIVSLKSLIKYTIDFSGMFLPKLMKNTDATIEQFITYKKTLNLLKNAPTKVTDQIEPEVLQNLRETVTVNTEEFNIRRKHCEIIQGELIVGSKDLINEVKKVVATKVPNQAAK